MNELVTICEKADYVTRTECTQYVAGVIDGLAEAQIFQPIFPQFCLPPGTSKGDLLDMTLSSWLANRRGNEGFVSVAWYLHVGLVTRYPCPSSRR